MNEPPLRSPSGNKESFVKQKTRAKFQQLMKSPQSSLHDSVETSDQVEEIPLLIKPAPRTLITKKEKVRGTSNMGYTTEDKVTSLLPSSAVENTEIFSISNDSLSQNRGHSGKEVSDIFSSVHSIPETHRRQNTSLVQQHSDESVSPCKKSPHPVPIPRAKQTVPNIQTKELNEYENMKSFVKTNDSSLLSCSTLQSITNKNSYSEITSPKNDQSGVVGKTTIQDVEHINQNIVQSVKNDTSDNNRTRRDIYGSSSISTNKLQNTNLENCERNLKGNRKQQIHSASSKDQTEIESDVSSRSHLPTEDDSSLEERVLSVTIHHSDRLETKLMIFHPLVHVHILDAEKGEYLKKPNRERAVTSFYETQHSNVDYIMPIMTQPSKFLEKGLPYPSWDEQLVFNENFNYFIKEDRKVVLFFEVLEFFKGSSAQKKFHRLQSQSGLKKVAWAFLKLVGGNNVINIGKNLRLQLYEVPSVKLKSSILDVYYWWSKLQKKALKSSLYVTIEPITLLAAEPALRSMFPLQQESGKTTLEELAKFLNNGVTSSPKISLCDNDLSRTESSMLYQWTRVAGQPCKIPNKQILSLSTYPHQCFSLKFSNNGRRLAAGIGSRQQHFALVYEIPTGSLVSKQSVHSGIIYDLDWFSDDKFMLSASADCTVRIWYTTTWECMAVLPHPSFVYSAKFHPSLSAIVGTACYDHLVRIWIISSINNAQLLKELEGHHSYINSLSWNNNGSLLFSADNTGEVKVWNIECFGRIPKKDCYERWGLKTEVILGEIKGVPINHIHFDAKEGKLLLFCRDSIVRLCDWKRSTVIRRFSGSVNCKSLLRGSLSPCGNLVYLGGEDGKVYVWNFHTGAIVTVYSGLHYSSPVASIVYHPHDHIVAMCCLEENAPIVVFQYDDEVPSIQGSSDYNLECSSGSLTLDLDLSPHNCSTFSNSATLPDKERIPSKKKINIFSNEPRKEIVKVSTSHKFPYVVPVKPGKPTSRIKDDFTYSPKRPILHKADNMSDDSWDSKSEADLPLYIALNDYQPQRGDELRLHKGDKISILKQETENWWIGTLENGHQGYFPSSHVTTEENYLADSMDEGSNESTPSALTAVITESGKFEIISVPDEKIQLPHSSNSKMKSSHHDKELLLNVHQTALSENPKRHHRRNLQKALQQQK